mgnify:CR=1 FL=1
MKYVLYFPFRAPLAFKIVPDNFVEPLGVLPSFNAIINCTKKSVNFIRRGDKVLWGGINEIRPVFPPTGAFGVKNCS